MKTPNTFPILKRSILKGLCPPAQGCEERATLGNRARALPTLKGLRHCSVVIGRPDIWVHNPFRVEFVPSSPPRVARSSQPWALRRNPFGILGLDCADRTSCCERIRCSESPTRGRRCFISPRE